ncbi:NADH:flavin oxidoreductase/NADH oxidase [Enterococcus faecium]|uniref:NADH:flavin oxidoreductase/NADH oxidase n=1 Tax=Enterococcus faecium TaxID=1352 RepID=UPI00338FEFFF
MNLWTPLTIKGLSVKNRVVLPPMCMYSVFDKDGYLTPWHITHYVSRAVGGCGLIIIEMTAIDPDGRITDLDLGLWEDGQIQQLKQLVDQCHAVGTKVAIQIAHAGRKAQDATNMIAPSAIPFDENYATPREMDAADISRVISQFQSAAKRAVAAGVDAIEVHAAHGYLIHQFQSAYSNKRRDKYGKDLSLFGTEVITAMKAVIPESMPLITRISAVEYVKDGYDLEHSLTLAKAYKAAGTDIFHVSSGGDGAIDGIGKAAFQEGYQIPYAQKYKEELNIPVIGVGKIRDPHYANQVIHDQSSDLVAIGRGMLHDPYWTLHAGESLGKLNKREIPKQYRAGF